MNSDPTGGESRTHARVRRFLYPTPGRAAQPPRLWRLSIALTVAIIGTVIVGLTLYALVVWLAGGSPRQREPLGSGAENQRLFVELAKVALGIAAAAAAVLALTVGYRRHRIETAQSYRDEERLFTDRFEAAAKLLGEEQAAVRLAGLHALAQLADDWESQRQTCVDVLCTYGALPVEDPGKKFDHERELRATILRVIADRLRPVPVGGLSWAGLHFNLRGIAVHGDVRFTLAMRSGVLDFSGATLGDDAHLSFEGSTFDGGRLVLDRLRFDGLGVNLNKVTVSAGEISARQLNLTNGAYLTFEDANFNGGTVSLEGMTLLGSRLSFDRAGFAGAAVTLTATGSTDDPGKITAHDLRSQELLPPMLRGLEGPLILDRRGDTGGEPHNV